MLSRNDFTNPLRSIQSIMAPALDYARSKKMGRDQSRGTAERNDTVYKSSELNVDAAFDIDTGSGGTGAIIVIILVLSFLGEDGLCSTWRMQSLPRLDCPLCDGFVLAGDIGRNKLLIESVCMEVVSFSF